MFYITLPSNSSYPYFPENNACHFKTKLPQAFRLNPNYEVGLSEIQFSNHYMNIDDKDLWFEIRDYQHHNPGTLKGNHIVLIPPGSYTNNSQFIRMLNALMREHIGPQSELYGRIHFFYDPVAEKAGIGIEKDCVEKDKVEHEVSVTFTPSLRRILKIGNIYKKKEGRFVGAGVVDLNPRFNSLFVYCDIVTPRPVGDVMVPLLRALPLKDSSKETTHYIFEKPHYIPLERFEFNDIEILLNTDTGKIIPFINGHTIVTLHFRQKRSHD